MSSPRTSHARRFRTQTGPTDRRRNIAALLSGLVPGLGQAFNARWPVAAVFLVPALLLALIAWGLLNTQGTTRLAATFIIPTTMSALMVLNVLVLLWRGVAVGHAWADRRFQTPPGRGAVIGLALVLAFVAVPHLGAWYVGNAASEAFRTVFSGSGEPGEEGIVDESQAPGPSDQERINVLLIGVDSGGNRTQALTDTLILASVDPVGRSMTMISIPRDLAGVPLGNGDVFGPKINSLFAYANRHPDEFPQGGRRALMDAVGALLGVPVHYYAQVNLGGFVKMVDAVGGVDITVTKALSDPEYGGYGVGPGWSIAEGTHHLDGANALAYARVRRAAGESDFTRAARQQQVLVALRNEAVKGDLLMSLPSLLRAIGDTVRTDLPAERLPGLAALAEEIDAKHTIQMVLKSPMVKRGPEDSQYGYILVAQPEVIAEMVATVMPPAGEVAQRWPTPAPTVAPSPSAGP